MNTKRVLSMLALIAILVAAPSVLGLSNGALPFCDLGSIEKWGSNFMIWSHAPGPDTLFAPDIPSLFDVSGLTITAGSTKLTNQFLPGQPTPITITTKSIEWRYLGIVMYAINVDPMAGTVIPGVGWTTISNETSHQVGTWSVSPNDAFQTLFNDQCLTHIDSELKPLQSTVWLTVPEGVPTVWLRVMFKIGEQNNGWMVYPSVQVKLDAAFSTPATSTPATPIALADPGTTCDNACQSTYNPNSACDATKMNTITDMSSLNTLFPAETCNPAFAMSVCSSANPVLNDTAGGFCSFNPAGCTKSFDCGATDITSHRICACTDGTKAAAPGSGTPTPSPSSSSTSGSSFPTVAVAVGVSIGVAAAFAIFIAYGLYRRQKFQSNNINNTYIKGDVTMGDQQQASMRPVMPSGRV